MQRAEAIHHLTEHRKELLDQYGVAFLAIFGSTESDQATETSDIDLLLEFRVCPRSKYIILDRFILVATTKIRYFISGQTLDRPTGLFEPVKEMPEGVLVPTAKPMIAVPTGNPVEILRTVN